MAWLKEGDKNTKFFHRMATVRSRVNFLGRVRRGGRILENPIEVKNEIACFFEELYKCESLKMPKLDGFLFPRFQMSFRVGWKGSLRMMRCLRH